MKSKGWRKGKTLEDAFGEERAKDIRLKISKSRKGKPGHPQSEKTRKKISDAMRDNTNWVNSTDKSGNSKVGHYNGHYFNSSWELAYIVYCIDNGIKVQRNKEYFDYIDTKGKSRKYVPDFIMEDGTYLEIKGYYTENVAQKLLYFPHAIVIYYEKDMKIFIDYAIDKYGLNFVETLKDPKIEKIKPVKREDFLKMVKQKSIDDMKDKYLDMIKTSDIDFTAYGWQSKLARLLGCSRTHTLRILKKILPDVLETNMGV